MPPMTSRVPRMSRAQVAWFSQPGLRAAVVSSRTPGCAAAFMMIRLYGVSRRSDGFQSRAPTPLASQKVCREGSFSGARVPGTSWLVTGSAPVPRSIEDTEIRGISCRYAAALSRGARPTKAGAFDEVAVILSLVSPKRANGASLPSIESTSSTTTAYPEVATRCMLPLKAPPASRCCMAAQNAPPASSAGSPAVSNSMPRIVRNTRIAISPFSVVLRRPYRPKYRQNG